MGKTCGLFVYLCVWKGDLQVCLPSSSIPPFFFVFNVDFTNAVCWGLLFRPLYLSIPCGHLGEFFAGWGGSWRIMSTCEKVGRWRFSIAKMFQNWCGGRPSWCRSGLDVISSPQRFNKVGVTFEPDFYQSWSGKFDETTISPQRVSKFTKKMSRHSSMNRSFTVVGIYSESFGNHPLKSSEPNHDSINGHQVFGWVVVTFIPVCFFFWVKLSKGQRQTPSERRSRATAIGMVFLVGGNGFFWGSPDFFERLHPWEGTAGSPKKHQIEKEKCLNQISIFWFVLGWFSRV